MPVIIVTPRSSHIRVPGFRSGRRHAAKALLLTLAFVLSALLGCEQTTSEPKAPELSLSLPKSQGKYLFGVTDTITISFNEGIDTGALAIEFTPPEGIGHKFAGTTKLLVFGKNKLYNLGYFNVNSQFSLALTSLRAPNGSGQPRLDLAFQPFTWADRDFTDSTFDGYDSLNATDSTWVNGAKVSDTLITEGVVNSKKTIGIPDYQDNKVLTLFAGDTLHASLQCTKDVDMTLMVAGPFTKAGYDSVTHVGFDPSLAADSANTGTKGAASISVGANFKIFKTKFGDISAPGIYVLYISVPPLKAGFYRLRTQIQKF